MENNEQKDRVEWCVYGVNDWTGDSYCLGWFNTEREAYDCVDRANAEQDSHDTDEMDILFFDALKYVNGKRVN